MAGKLFTDRVCVYYTVQICCAFMLVVLYFIMPSRTLNVIMYQEGKKVITLNLSQGALSKQV